MVRAWPTLLVSSGRLRTAFSVRVVARASRPPDVCANEEYIELDLGETAAIVGLSLQGGELRARRGGRPLCSSLRAVVGRRRSRHERGS